jgi:hypothetical protein
VFQENFGNTTTNGEACWSGGTGNAAQCAQLWNVDASSGETIVAAPSGWSGNALELPSESTAITLETAGSFPEIPGGSGFTLTLTVELSAYPSSYTTLIKLRQYYSGATSDGGNTEVGINAYTGGFEASSNGTTCSAAAGSTHTLVITETGTTGSKFTIDGTQCGATWTDPGYAVGAVLIGGGTSYNTYIQTITINGSTITGGWPPNVLMDWDAESGNTVNATNLAAGTHCGNAPSAWTSSTLTGVSFSFITDGQAFASPLSVCGTSYSNNTNTTLEMSVTTTSGSGGYWDLEFYTAYANASVGFYFKFNAAGTFNTIGLDIGTLMSSSGNQYGLQIQSNSGGTSWYVCGENYEGGGTAQCISSSLSQNTWYWVTFGIASSGTNYFWVYNVNGTLIQKVAFAGTFEATVPGTIDLYLGKTGAETMPNSANVYYSGVITEYADAAMPLLP